MEDEATRSAAGLARATIAHSSPPNMAVTDPYGILEGLSQALAGLTSPPAIAKIVMNPLLYARLEQTVPEQRPEERLLKRRALPFMGIPIETNAHEPHWSAYDSAGNRLRIQAASTRPGPT